MHSRVTKQFMKNRVVLDIVLLAHDPQILLPKSVELLPIYMYVDTFFAMDSTP